MSYSYIQAFEARDDLKKYTDNALLLFSVQVKYQVEDVDTLATDSLTDCSNDKKCDLLYIDPDTEDAVLAQGYFCQRSPKPASAPSNKASDLNTAVSWMLSRPIDDIPADIKASAIALRNSIENNAVSTLNIWYVHNLNESKNVSDELKTVEITANNALSTMYPNNKVTVKALEVGNNTLEEWYRDLQTNILVTEEFELLVPGGYEMNEYDWSAFMTAVPASWLHEIYQEHADKLFSANVRGYLGSRRSDYNINNTIKSTVSSTPENFWVFNNGLTILVNDYQMTPIKRGKLRGKIKLCLKGLSIVNGAQTTGSIGALASIPDSKAMIPSRFVKCTNINTIQDIIKFNNSQNKISTSDFRSNDSIQKRLVNEFKTIPSVNYNGGRRGGCRDIIVRSPNLLSADTAAQSLFAFHDNPVTAYNSKSEIWANNGYYSHIFNDNTTAKHILFVYSLLRAIEIKKRMLVEKKSSSPLKISEEEQLDFLKSRGSVYLLLSAISRCMEIIIDRPLPNKFGLMFKENIGLDIAIKHWQFVVDTMLPLHSRLAIISKKGLKSQDEVNKAIKDFSNMLESVKNVSPLLFHEFAKQVKY